MDGLGGGACGVGVVFDVGGVCECGHVVLAVASAGDLSVWGALAAFGAVLWRGECCDGGGALGWVAVVFGG